MPKVKMYTTTTCVFCRAEKAFFDEHKVDYEEVVLDEDPAAQREMIELSGQLGVPFTVITKDSGEEVKVLGFDQERLSESLGIHA